MTDKHFLGKIAVQLSFTNIDICFAQRKETPYFKRVFFTTYIMNTIHTTFQHHCICEHQRSVSSDRLPLFNVYNSTANNALANNEQEHIKCVISLSEDYLPTYLLTSTIISDEHICSFTVQTYRHPIAKQSVISNKAANTPLSFGMAGSHI